MANLLQINWEALEFYGFILVTSVYQPKMVQRNTWSSNKEFNTSIFFLEILQNSTSLWYIYKTLAIPKLFLHNFAIILKIVSVNTPLHTRFFFNGSWHS